MQSGERPDDPVREITPQKWHIANKRNFKFATSFNSDVLVGLLFWSDDHRQGFELVLHPQ